MVCDKCSIFRFAFVKLEHSCLLTLVYLVYVELVGKCFDPRVFLMHSSDYFLIGPNSKYFSFENFFISISSKGILPNFIDDKICLQFDNLFRYFFFTKIFKFNCNTEPFRLKGNIRMRKLGNNAVVRKEEDFGSY